MKYVHIEYLDDYQDRLNTLTDLALKELNQAGLTLYDIYQPWADKKINPTTIPIYIVSRSDQGGCNNS